MKTIAGISDKYRTILDEMHRTFSGPFSGPEVAARLNLPREKTAFLMSYFERKGWLSRIRRGLYVLVPLGTVNPSEYKEHPWIVANRVFDPCYIGGWSAAEHWEYTDQLFNSIVVFTSRRFRSKKMIIQGSEYILKFVGNQVLGKAKNIWLENKKIQISDPIQTIVDILDDPALGGGIRLVAEILKSYFGSEHRNDDAIVDYIEIKRNKSIYKRLGYLIDVMNIDAADLKIKCLERLSAGYSLLDPAVESKGAFVRKWNLKVNVEIKT